jgi:hypothetical protein
MITRRAAGAGAAVGCAIILRGGDIGQQDQQGCREKEGPLH